jgi:hypothetical protein
MDTTNNRTVVLVSSAVMIAAVLLGYVQEVSKATSPSGDPVKLWIKTTQEGENR